MDLKGVEQASLDAEECRSKSPHQVELNGCLTERSQHVERSGMGSEPVWTESSCPLPSHLVYVPQDRWMMGDPENFPDNLLHSCCTVEGAVDQRCSDPSVECWLCLANQPHTADSHTDRDNGPSLSHVMDSADLRTPSPAGATAGPELCSFMADTCGLIGSWCSVCRSSWDTIRSRIPSSSSDHCPVSAAAHLHLLGESLTLIGRHLEETDKRVCMWSSLSLLLDSLLCALAPLMCLTTQIPELTSCTEHTLASTLENVVYMMPGL
ncbi:uncharacterized protein LOC105936690 isoform X3 [Fundulus heteroclitus]|uniref:uncharacterized protein LOC105936690 isoform X3 n=1 Tax=Fundulus heteroclitus TaxID=8078 RepID=UPI00165AA46A|nr:uncharacterized protein LOC105936690 isoform X3 [Fundulus heteroclitus]